MTSKTRKLLEDYDIEGAGAFDLSVVLLGYLRQTHDDDSEKLRVIEGVLSRWRKAVETKAAPALIEKQKKVAGELREIAAGLTELVESLHGKSQ